VGLGLANENSNVLFFSASSVFGFRRLILHFAVRYTIELQLGSVWQQRTVLNLNFNFFSSNFFCVSVFGFRVFRFSVFGVIVVDFGFRWRNILRKADVDGDSWDTIFILKKLTTRTPQGFFLYAG